MDPFTIMAGVGFAMQLGGLFGSNEANEKAQEQARIQAGLEKQINEQKRNAMELNSRRQQMENVRNVQLARSMAISSSTAQGAQFGTGIQGGLGQIGAQGYWNNLGISQNTAIGENIYGLTNQISDSKVLQSQYQSEAATYQGMSQLGGSLMGASGKLGNVFGGFGGFSSQQNFGMNTYGGFVNGIGSNGIY